MPSRVARGVLENFGQSAPFREQIEQVVAGCGQVESSGFPPDLVATARNLLRSELSLPRADLEAPFDAELWRVLVSSGGDPKVHTCGISPPTAGKFAAVQPRNSHEPGRHRSGHTKATG